jgi:NADPH:quinone reductase
VLSKEGRYVLYGSMGGVQSEIDLRVVMKKMLSITGTTLRARPLEYKVKMNRRLPPGLCLVNCGPESYFV